jgi:mannose-6-phosphate isomerase-like protein (cupin superfamily)
MGNQQRENIMKGYVTNIERDTLDNEDFRRVLFTGKHTQLVLMTLIPGQDIGLETHEGHDQFIRIEAGTGEVVMDGRVEPISDGSAIVIPAGAEHNVTNTSADEPLKLYTLYSPPEHPDGTVEHEKPDND